MLDVLTYIADYSEADREQISFAWNGKHAADFQDLNQGFRWHVARQCIATPESASPLLLEHLFLADAAWTREAWGSPGHFAQLGAALLIRGQEAALVSFAKGFVCSFDTFGACHELQLPKELLVRLSLATAQELARATDDEHRKPLEAALELFGKLEAGSAGQGWATVQPGAPVAKIREIGRAHV